MNTELRSKEYHGRLLRDCIFIIAAFFLAFYYFSKTTRGIGICDEWSLIVSVVRLINGDAPMLHERSPVIFSCFSLYLPVKLFYALTGSYSGIVLFIRRIYVFCHLIFSSVIYVRLRKYDWFALFAAINYMCFIPNEMYTLYYNSISLMAIVTVCLLLFTGKKPGKIRLSLAGAVYACAVLALPHLAIAYFLWSIVVFIIKFTHKAPDNRCKILHIYFSVGNWLYITLGIAISAVIFFIVLFFRLTFGEFFSCLPDFVTYAIYSSDSVFSMDKLLSILQRFGYVPVFLMVLLLFIAAADRKKYNRRGLYLSLCTLIIAAMYFFLYEYYFSNSILYVNFLAIIMRAIPFYPIGILAYILSKEKNHAMLGFIVLCLVFSFFRDCSSNVVVGLGAPGADIAAAILLRGLLHEMFTDVQMNSSATAKRIAAVLCTISMVLALTSEAVWKIAGYNFNITEGRNTTTYTALTSEIEHGPLSGIKTTVRNKFIYSDVLKDLDFIQKNCSSLYIAGKFQYGYLCLDAICASDSTAFDKNKTEIFLLDYWEQFSERQPDCIYIPFYNGESYILERREAKEILDFFAQHFSFSVNNGHAGYILTEIKKI